LGMENGCNPIYVAAQKGELEIVRVLLEAGADVNRASNDGCTAIHALPRMVMRRSSACSSRLVLT